MGASVSACRRHGVPAGTATLMLLVAGIDPGVTGAIGVYDYDADKLVTVWPLPSYQIVVGKKTRTRLDKSEIKALFGVLKAMGVRLIGIENVQGGNFRGRKQSAAGGFQFGYTFGVLSMAAEMIGIPYDTASPAVWKIVERVPDTARGIVDKADVEFVEHSRLFHGPQGGLLHDRAEAAFLARYFARRIWPSRQPREGLRALADAVPTWISSAPPVLVVKNLKRGSQRGHNLDQRS